MGPSSPAARCSHWAHSPSIAASSWPSGRRRSPVATSARRPDRGGFRAGSVASSAYLSKIIDDRRDDPQDDLVSILVGAKDEGLLFAEEEGRNEGPAGDALDEMPTDELIMFLVLLLVAGNETTRNAISGGIQLLIENPEQCRRLIDDPELIPSAVEEMLRLVSSVHSFTRTVTQEPELQITFTPADRRSREDVSPYGRMAAVWPQHPHENEYGVARQRGDG